MGLGHTGTDKQWDYREVGHTGTGTQWSRTHWDWDTLGLTHNGIATQQKRHTARQGIGTNGNVYSREAGKKRKQIGSG